MRGRRISEWPTQTQSHNGSGGSAPGDSLTFAQKLNPYFETKKNFLAYADVKLQTGHFLRDL